MVRPEGQGGEWLWDLESAVVILQLQGSTPGRSCGLGQAHSMTSCSPGCINTPNSLSSSIFHLLSLLPLAEFKLEQDREVRLKPPRAQSRLVRQEGTKGENPAYTSYSDAQTNFS